MQLNGVKRMVDVSRDGLMNKENFKKYLTDNGVEWRESNFHSHTGEDDDWDIYLVDHDSLAIVDMGLSDGKFSYFVRSSDGTEYLRDGYIAYELDPNIIEIMKHCLIQMEKAYQERSNK